MPTQSIDIIITTFNKNQILKHKSLSCLENSQMVQIHISVHTH